MQQLSAFFLRHTITTAVQLCWSVENFGILNHNSTRCTCKVFLFWGRVHISRPYCSRILNFSRIYFLEQKMKQNSAKVMKQNFWIVLFSRILNFGRKSNGFVFCWKIKFCKSCGMWDYFITFCSFTGFAEFDFFFSKKTKPFDFLLNLWNNRKLQESYIPQLLQNLFCCCIHLISWNSANPVECQLGRVNLTLHRFCRIRL